MSLLTLPPELLLTIAENLQGHQKSLSALTRTNRFFYNLFTAELYRTNALNRNSSALLWACKHGHESVARLALAHGADTQVTFSKRERITPLMLASLFGYLGIARLLLYEAEGVVDVNFRGTKGHTALSLAVHRGHLDIVRLLLAQKGIDPNDFAHGERIPLCIAAEKGNVDIVRALVEDARGTILLDYAGERGRTPLSLAVGVRGNVGIARYLLHQRREDGTSCVDVNSRCPNGCTPLSYAALAGDAEIVETLLAIEGIEVDGPDAEGAAPLVYALRSGNPAVVKMLLDTGRVDASRLDSTGRRPLSHACDGESARLLLAVEGVDPNAGRTSGPWALLDATANRHTAVVQVLLSDPRVTAPFLDISIYNALLEVQTHEIAQLFLSRPDLDPNLRHPSRRTMLSSLVGRTGVVQAFLECPRVDPNVRDTDGRTPLISAVLYGSKRCMELFLKCERVDANARDVDGMTALAHAVAWRDVDKVRVLLDCARVDPLVPDRWGATVYDKLEVSGGREEIYIDVVRRVEGR